MIYSRYENMVNVFLVDLKFIYWLLLVPLVLIFGLMIAAIVIRIVKYNKLKKASKPEEIDEEQRQMFIEVYGGLSNILKVNQDMSRLTVEVKDLGKVDVHKLKELGATGVLVTGNIIKASFGERAKYIKELLK